MALTIVCPHCGARPHHEFTYGGEWRPLEATGADADFARIFLPNNDDGSVRERWYHGLGCGRWCTITRNTTTNVGGP